MNRARIIEGTIKSHLPRVDGLGEGRARGRGECAEGAHAAAPVADALHGETAARAIRPAFAAAVHAAVWISAYPGHLTEVVYDARVAQCQDVGAGIDRPQIGSGHD